MMLTLMVTSKGVAAVPRASLVILAGTLASFGLPLEAVAVILGVDELMDMARTTVNLIGNCLATCVMARWEGEFDDNATGILPGEENRPPDARSRTNRRRYPNPRQPRAHHLHPRHRRPATERASTPSRPHSSSPRGGRLPGRCRCPRTPRIRPRRRRAAGPLPGTRPAPACVAACPRRPPSRRTSRGWRGGRACA